MVKTLRPFWRYYGGKWRNALHYPAPLHDTVIEPFAGAAGYSLRHYRRRVILVDKSPIIAGIWRYLTAATPEEIRRLPDIPDGGTVDDLDAPQEARWLAGYLLANAQTHPNKRPSRWAREYPEKCGWTAKARDRIASQVEAIRHWRIIEGEYHDAPDIVATWHIDPPYAGPAGRRYPCQPDDFAELGAWCRTRRGQVMVCEQEGADWLPFRLLGSFRSTAGAGKATRSAEVIWTHESS